MYANRNQKNFKYNLLRKDSKNSKSQNFDLEKFNETSTMSNNTKPTERVRRHTRKLNFFNPKDDSIDTISNENGNSANKTIEPDFVPVNFQQYQLTVDQPINQYSNLPRIVKAKVFGAGMFLKPSNS